MSTKSKAVELVELIQQEAIASYLASKSDAPVCGRPMVPLHSVGIRLPFDLFVAIRSYLGGHQQRTGFKLTFNESMIEAIEAWARSKGIDWQDQDA